MGGPGLSAESGRVLAGRLCSLSGGWWWEVPSPDGQHLQSGSWIQAVPLFSKISDIQVTGQSEDMTAKEKLLLWSQRMVEGYQGLRCDNFTSSWRDGRLFNAVIHRHK